MNPCPPSLPPPTFAPSQDRRDYGRECKQGEYGNKGGYYSGEYDDGKGDGYSHYDRWGRAGHDWGRVACRRTAVACLPVPCAVLARCVRPGESTARYPAASCKLLVSVAAGCLTSARLACT